MDTIKLKHLPDGRFVTDPFITSDEWLSVLREAGIEGKTGQIQALLRFFRMPAHKGTCSAVAKVYGTNSDSERSLITNFGMYTRKALGNRFIVESSESDDERYWPIPMLGKDLGKKGFEWTVRPELVKALREYVLDLLLNKYRQRVLAGGLNNQYSKELYKWQKLADCKGQSDLGIIMRMIDMNLISWRAAASLRKMLDKDAEETVRVFSILKGPDRRFADKFKEYKAETEKIAIGGILNNINNDRTAALFLACLDPVKNAIFKFEQYKTLCDYLGYSIKGSDDNYEHYVNLLQPIIEREKADLELTAKLHAETDPYFWSDLLNAQDVLWQMRRFMEDNIKTKTIDMFTWIPFYKELAQKLHAYKDNRQAILDFIYDEIPEGYRYYFHDIDGEPNVDVDPYTVFAMFNRYITDKQRVEICSLFKEKFSVQAPLPKDFMGIPTWNNMKSQLFGFRDKRGEKDVENLWALFDAIMSGQDWKAPFDIVGTQHMAGAAMVTSGMFWTRPDDFIPLDQNTVKHLKECGINVPIKNTRIDATSYADVCDKLKELISLGKIHEQSFAEFAAAARGTEKVVPGSNQITQKTYYDEIVSTLKTKKNIILQGAPGTGKTYAIPEIVTRLCGEKIDYSNRKDVMDSYKKLSADGRVVFTTFHQSMDYEDFIEGLKPEVDDSDNIHYEVKPGIFAKLCSAAKSLTHDDQIKLGEDPTIWKVSLERTGDNKTRRDCLKNGYIRVGFDEAGPLLDGDIPMVAGRAILDALINKMAIGDIVMSCYSSRTVDAIGVITGEYEWRDDFSEYKRVRLVNWLIKGINEDIVEINGGKSMTLSTVYRLKSITIDDVLSILKKHKVAGIDSTEKNTKPYVLVIDEINRGNISKIFGELITLIEPEKRADGDMPLSVVLPYSKKPFEIPSNVYIIGTMNTADRSLTQFDYAMRRRFRFVGMHYGKVPINLDDSHKFDEELFHTVTDLFISNFDEFLDNDQIRILRAECFSPEFDPVDMWIGPSYFIYDIDEPEGIADHIQYEIIPTLRQYIADGVFVDPDAVEKVISQLKQKA